MTIHKLYKFRLNDELMQDIESVIYNYAGKVCVAEVVGVLEMLKLRIVEEMDDD